MKMMMGLMLMLLAAGMAGCETSGTLARKNTPAGTEIGHSGWHVSGVMEAGVSVNAR